MEEGHRKSLKSAILRYKVCIFKSLIFLTKINVITGIVVPKKSI